MWRNVLTQPVHQVIITCEELGIIIRRGMLLVTVVPSFQLTAVCLLLSVDDIKESSEARWSLDRNAILSPLFTEKLTSLKILRPSTGFLQFLYIQDLVTHFLLLFEDDTRVFTAGWLDVFYHQFFQSFLTGSSLFGFRGVSISNRAIKSSEVFPLIFPFLCSCHSPGGQSTGMDSYQKV